MAEPPPPDLASSSADASSSAAVAAASSDALPALLSQLLHDVSVECARVDGWSEHKQLIQSKIKGQAAACSEPAASVAASSAPLSFGSLPAFPSDDSASASSVAAPSVAASSMAAIAPASSSSSAPRSVPSSSPAAAAPDAASSDSLPSESLPLLRQLSDAAALGVISHSTKVEIKNLLLNARVSSVLAPTRLVRGITETGEETVTEQQIDTSNIDPQQATQMQDEEREALEAIYEGMVTFGQSLETEGQDDEDADQTEEQGEEQKQQQTDDDDGDGGEDEEGEEEDNQGEDDEDEDEEEEAPAEPADAAAATTPASESASAASASTPAPSVSSVASSASTPAAPPAVLCRTVDIDVLPYPASSARNPVSAVLRFTLPPLYPFVRPSFRLLSVKGELLQSDGLMMGTAINEQLNTIYAKGEPLAEEDARPCIFDLVTAAQEFLIEYVGFLEDAAYHKQVAADKAVRDRLQADIDRVAAAKAAREAAILAEQIAHAAAVVAFQRNEATPQIVYDSTFNTPAEEARRAANREAERKREAAKAEAERLHQEKAKATQEELDRAYADADKIRADFQRESKARGSSATQAINDLMPTPASLLAHLQNSDAAFHNAYAASFRAGAVYAESIASPFLIYRFLRRREEMIKLGREAAVSIGFHGTLPQHVASITQNGLAVPGQSTIAGRTVVHRCDIGYFGRGIYLSPAASFSLGYGSWNNLFVCLVLRGTSFKCEYNLGCALEPGYDSHHAPSGMEWIIFNDHQVLPIYLLKGSPLSQPAPVPVAKVAAAPKTKANAPHSALPPPSSKSAKLLLAKLAMQQTQEKSGTKKGPVSTTFAKKKAKKATAAATAAAAAAAAEGKS